MSSPAAKRRKKNDFQPSPQKAGSLDFFFSKQKNGLVTIAKGEELAKITTPRTGQIEGKEERPLTDEELARQLQDEWNSEEAARFSVNTQNETSTKLNGEVRDEAGTPPCAPTVSLEKEEIIGKGPVHTKEKATLSLQSAAAVEDTVTSEIPFDENPLIYNPQAYLPRLKECWASEGGLATYGLLTRCFILINSTQSRIKIVDTLVNLLRTIIEGDRGSLLPTVRSIDLGLPYTD